MEPALSFAPSSPMHLDVKAECVDSSLTSSELEKYDGLDLSDFDELDDLVDLGDNFESCFQADVSCFKAADAALLGATSCKPPIVSRAKIKAVAELPMPAVTTMHLSRSKPVKRAASDMGLVLMSGLPLDRPSVKAGDAKPALQHHVVPRAAKRRRRRGGNPPRSEPCATSSHACPPNCPNKKSTDYDAFVRRILLSWPECAQQCLIGDKDHPHGMFYELGHSRDGSFNANLEETVRCRKPRMTLFFSCIIKVAGHVGKSGLVSQQDQRILNEPGYWAQLMASQPSNQARAYIVVQTAIRFVAAACATTSSSPVQLHFPADFVDALARNASARMTSLMQCSTCGLFEGWRRCRRKACCAARRRSDC